MSKFEKLASMNTKAYKLIALILVSSGVVLLAYEGYRFFELTDLVKNPEDFDETAVAITSSIGAIIGGTVGVIFSLASVIFFVTALKSQQEESKIIRGQADLQSLEISIFNLFAIQNDIRKSIFNTDNSAEVTHFKRNRPQSLSNIKNIDFSFENLFKGLGADSKFLISKDKNGITQYSGEYIVYKDDYNWQSADEMLRDYYLINPNELIANGKKEVYKRFMGEFRSVIGHYFRNLYHVLKYLYDKEQEEIKYDKNMQEVYIK
jgi:uncharacterized membrane protein YidH (DUF202 family)